MLICIQMIYCRMLCILILINDMDISFIVREILYCRLFSLHYTHCTNLFHVLWSMIASFPHWVSFHLNLVYLFMEQYFYNYVYFCQWNERRVNIDVTNLNSQVEMFMHLHAKKLFSWFKLKKKHIRIKLHNYSWNLALNIGTDCINTSQNFPIVYCIYTLYFHIHRLWHDRGYIVLQLRWNEHIYTE